MSSSIAPRDKLAAQAPIAEEAWASTRRDRSRFAPVLVVAFASAGALITLASRAIGQPAPSPTVAAAPAADATQLARESARDHFDRGVGFFENGEWNAALAEFLASRALYPSRGNTKNAAICLGRVGRYDEAIVMFQALLATPNLPPEDRERAERGIRELEPKVGAIDLRGAEAGATIAIDERSRGTLPAPPLRVNVGTHTIRVFKEGFERYEARVDVAGGETKIVAVVLRRFAVGGRLKIFETNGLPLDVVVDGAVVGRAPWQGSVAPGRHTVLLRGDREQGTQPTAIDVDANRTTPLSLTAEALPSTLRIEPTPAGALVALDGVDLGHGAWEGRVRAGEHRVEVASEGFLAATRAPDVRAGGRDVVAVSLERDPTSPLWKRGRSRFVLEAESGFAVAPAFGGDAAAACKKGCAASVPSGVVAALRGGYELANGLGAALEGGFVDVGRSVRGHDVGPEATGFARESGRANDSVELRGATVGASVSLHLGERFPFRARLGAGALLGSVSLHRQGTFVTANPDVPTRSYPLDERVAASTTGIYVAPEIGLGARVVPHFELALDVGVTVIDLLHRASYADQTFQVPVDGLASFRDAPTGSVVVLFAPELAARIDF